MRCKHCGQRIEYCSYYGWRHEETMDQKCRGVVAEPREKEGK